MVNNYFLRYIFMNNIKKYLIWFIIWLSLVWSIWYASNNYGSIGSLFDNIGTWTPTLNWKNITNWTIIAWKLATGSIDNTNIKNWSIKKEDLSDSLSDLLNITDCTLNWTIILGWHWITVYYKSTVPYWSTCTSQTRTCTNWNLSWTYSYSNCSVLSLANSNDCSTIWWYCYWWKYVWNNTVVQVSDLSEANWDDAITECSNSTIWWHSDWFLPNKDQLNVLYTNKNIIWGFSSGYNWSSTESYSSINARSQNFDDGYQADGIDKDHNNNVRCIRTF